jgi:hypothetical protein
MVRRLKGTIREQIEISIVSRLGIKLDLSIEFVDSCLPHHYKIVLDEERDSYSNCELVDGANANSNFMLI